MKRNMLRAKVHRITVTETELEYEGSLTLDQGLMEAADMLPFERVDVYDIANGNRFATYLIAGEKGSGVCCVNGAAAHKVELGDKLILAAYVSVEESVVRDHRPKVVLIDDDNKIVDCRDSEQAATRFSS